MAITALRKNIVAMASTWAIILEYSTVFMHGLNYLSNVVAMANRQKLWIAWLQNIEVCPDEMGQNYASHDMTSKLKLWLA